MSPLNMRSLTFLPLAALLRSISAAPFYPVTTELDSRGVGGTGASVLGSVASLISSLLPKATSAWDYDKLPSMCRITMSTDYQGSGCKTNVDCGGYSASYNEWNVCYVGGRQYFNDPQIGEFTITYTQAGGQHYGFGTYDGLTNPILTVTYIESGAQWDVRAFADNTTSNLQNSDFSGTCADWTPHSTILDNLHTQTFVCGVPKIGKGFSGTDGTLDSNGPVNAAGYAPGWCGIHVVQYQRTSDSGGAYKFDVALRDSNENIIGSVTGVPGTVNQAVNVDSKLPWVMIVTAGTNDQDAVYMAYAGQVFGSNDQDHHCNFGTYDNGKREGDCGFTC